MTGVTAVYGANCPKCGHSLRDHYEERTLALDRLFGGVVPRQFCVWKGCPCSHAPTNLFVGLLLP